MKWEPFMLGEQVFDLSHLDPFEFEFIILAKDGRPERHYAVNVNFSSHCFTKDFVEGRGYSSEYEYDGDPKEVRLFNEERYALSKHLPKMFKNMKNRKCFHTQTAGNYLLVETVICDGKSFSYQVFFRLTKGVQKNELTLFVISAYPPDLVPAPDLRTSPRKAIGFSVLVFKTAAGERIKQPR